MDKEEIKIPNQEQTILAYHAGVHCIVQLLQIQHPKQQAHQTKQREIILGSYRENLGYGISERQENPAMAVAMAKRKALQDAIKRTLHDFGY